MRVANNFKDLTGLRFGKRVVVSRAPTIFYNGKAGSSMWLVRCDCGNETTMQSGAVRKTTSCGCDESYAKKSGTTRRNPLPLEARRNKSHLKNRFCLTVEQFEQMRLEQNNCCKICGEEFVVTPSVDHDHSCCPSHKTCGKCVRGLLCKKCNAGMGSMNDSKILLQKAIDYLTEYEHQASSRFRERCFQ